MTKTKPFIITPKKIYNMTTKKRQLLKVIQRKFASLNQNHVSYNILVKLQACSCNISKNGLLLVFHRFFSKIRLLFRNTHLKEHLCMVASEHITQTRPK